MKTSSLTKKFFQRQTDHLLLLFEKPVVAFSEIDVHRIRVDIKRIHALLALLNHVHPPFQRKKNYAPFKIIFRQAGKIRDLQVQLLLIQSYTMNSPIENCVKELNMQLLEEKKTFYRILTPQLIKQLRKKTSAIQHFLDRVNHNATLQFISKKQKTIQKLLDSTHLRSADLHNLRKRIKEFYYLQKMLEPKTGRCINTDQFQELLGKWHDGRVLKLGLKNFRKSGSLLREDILTFESLQIKMANDNQQLYEKIVRDKNGFLQLLA